MISYLILRMSIFILNIYSIDTEEKLSSQINLISNIIDQFNGHNIIYHYDNSSINGIDEIATKIEINSSILMINYDFSRDKINKNNMIERPIGYKFLHIVLLHNYSRLIEYTNTSRYSFNYLDIIFVLSNLNTDNETVIKEFDVKLYNVNITGAFFILDVWSSSLYHVCFFCGKNKGKWQKLADLTDIIPDYFSPVRYLVQDVYKNQFNDFNGHTFWLGYTVYEPFFWCTIEKINNRTWYTFFGSEGGLLVALRNKLNFNFGFTKLNDIDSIIEAIQNGSISWAMGGITITISRSKEVDFTNYINTEPYAVLYSLYDDPWKLWLNVINPFQYSIWFILIISIILISGLFFIAMNIAKTKTNYEFRYFIQGCLRLLVEQPLTCVRDAVKSRWTTTLLMVLWFYVALILTNAYKSKLTSSLIHSRAEEYNNADDLLKLGYEFYTEQSKYSVVHEYLENSGDKSFLSILNRSKIDKDFCASVLLTKGNKIAIIDEETFIHYSIEYLCDEYMIEEQKEDLRLVKNDFFPSQHAWPMPLNAPYRNSMNLIISRLHATGLINIWNAQYLLASEQVLKSNHKRSRNSHSSQNTFKLPSLIGPAIIWLTGMIAASISFVIEMLRGKKLKC